MPLYGILCARQSTLDKIFNYWQIILLLPGCTLTPSITLRPIYGHGHWLNRKQTLVQSNVTVVGQSTLNKEHFNLCMSPKILYPSECISQSVKVRSVRI